MARLSRKAAFAPAACVLVFIASTASALPTSTPRRALRESSPPSDQQTAADLAARAPAACPFVVRYRAELSAGGGLAGLEFLVGATAAGASAQSPAPPRLAWDWKAAPPSSPQVYAIAGATATRPPKLGWGEPVPGPYAVEGLAGVNGSSAAPAALFSFSALASGPPPGEGAPADGVRPPIANGTALFPSLLAVSPPDPAGLSDGKPWWDAKSAQCAPLERAAGAPAPPCAAPGPCEGWWLCCGGGAAVTLPGGALRLIRPADKGGADAAAASVPSASSSGGGGWLKSHGPALGGAIAGATVCAVALSMAVWKGVRAGVARSKRVAAAAVPASKAFPQSSGLEKVVAAGGGDASGPTSSTTIPPCLPDHVRGLTVSVPMHRVESGALTLPSYGGGGGGLTRAPGGSGGSGPLSSSSPSPSAAARRRVAARLAGLVGQPPDRRWTWAVHAESVGEAAWEGATTAPAAARVSPPSPPVVRPPPPASPQPPITSRWAWVRPLRRRTGTADVGPPPPSSPPSSSSAVRPPAPVPAVDFAREVTLCERLGVGASGAVHRGLWRGREVAVKLLRPGGESGDLSTFRQEVEVLARIRHAGVVALLGACLDVPTPCLILEYVPDGSLADRLAGRPPPAALGPAAARAPPPSRPRPGPLPYPTLLRISLDVATALAALHAGSPAVIHRDVKPGNILLRAGGRAVLADFGVSRTSHKTVLSTVVTAAGTPAYMAPEQFEGGAITAKVDAWAFGVLLWQCVSGREPWAGAASPLQIIYAVGVRGKRLAIPSRVPPPLAGLMKACWASDPAARPTLAAAAGVLRGELARVSAARGAAAAVRARGLGGWGVGL